MSVFRILAPLVIFATLLIGCGEPDAPTGPVSIKLGLLPDQDPDEQSRRYRLLTAYLQKATGYEVELARSATYAELVQQFGSGEIDMALFGGYTYLLAYHQHRAHGLVLRDTGHKYHSSFITRRDDPRSKLSEFAGESLVFGSELSTSGHMMPRYYLERWGIHPESSFKDIQYSGSHTRTIELVSATPGALGVANADIVEHYLNVQGDSAQIRIVRMSPGYTDYVWAVQGDMPMDQKMVLRNAMLNLSLEEPESAAVLASVRAEGFLPALPEDFDRLQVVMDGMQSD